ncbi:MAG: IMPACT family protein [Bacteroidales bacterium]|nr:IMPACT family protein [Bacteroidales bacterium]
MDTYLTIAARSEGLYKEKMSKFLSFAEPCSTVEQAKEIVTRYKKEYFDARHVCWAYMLGNERTEFRSNDDGEPSGTAGKPILGQINSFELTNLCVIVVRYFGGIKLGTSGLIEAYRTAAQEALNAAQIEERIIEETLVVHYQYPMMGEAMRIAKEEGANVLAQDFGEDCRLTLSLRRDAMPRMRARYEKTYGISIVEDDGNSN